MAEAASSPTRLSLTPQSLLRYCGFTICPGRLSAGARAALQRRLRAA